MKLIGNISDIKSKRNTKNQAIELHLDQVEYVTYKKDGHYFQAFNCFIDLDTPLVITGDCLARIENKYLEEGEYTFQVFDKNGDEYMLNPDKQLSITILYDFDLDESILTEINYAVTVPMKEFEEIKNKYEKGKNFKKGKR